MSNEKSTGCLGFIRIDITTVGLDHWVGPKHLKTNTAFNTPIDVKCVHQNGKCVVTHHQFISRASETFMVLSVRLSTLIVATSNDLHCHSHSQTVFLPTMFNTGCSKITSITFHVLCFTSSPPSSPSSTSPSLSSSLFMIVVIISPHKMLGAEHFLSIFVVNASFHTEKNASHINVSLPNFKWYDIPNESGTAVFMPEHISPTFNCPELLRHWGRKSQKSSNIPYFLGSFGQVTSHKQPNEWNPLSFWVWGTHKKWSFAYKWVHQTPAW